MNLYFEYPTYLIIIAIIISFALAFIFYRKDKQFDELKTWKRCLLTGLRFTFILCICFLLLKPVFKHKTAEIQKPIIVIAQDNTRSILLNKDSLYYANEYKKDIYQLESELSKNYDVRFYTFSDNTYNSRLIDFSGELTDISSVFTEISTRLSGMNLGAIILATDGIYNKASNPEYSSLANVPIYSIALGDTTAQKDLIIQDLKHNSIAFLGNKFPLQLSISSEKSANSQSRIIIRNKDKIVYSKDFRILENSEYKTFDIELHANDLGVQKYDIELEHLENEISYENNHSSIVINVVDNTNKILILANAPHPEIGAIRSSLKDNPNFEVEIQYIDQMSKSVKDYQLIILHQLPSHKNKASNIISEISKNKIPTIYILGSESSLQAFNSLENGLSIHNKSNQRDEATASFNDKFMTFDLGLDKEISNRFSPLRVFFGDYIFSDESKILFYQVINGIKTEKPLIAFTERNRTKNAFILGEGIWHWRIDDYKYNSEHSNFNSIINHMAQYLVVKSLSNILVVESKQIFNENEPVKFNSSFNNEAYEFVPNLDIRLKLIDEDKKEFEYSFTAYSDSYHINIGRLQAGKYTYLATTTFDDKEYTATNDFIVKKINLEAINTCANHRLLNILSQKTKGKLVYPSEIHKISQYIDENTDIVSLAYEKEKLYFPTDLYLLFFLILLLAGSEWSLRKFWGSY